MSDDRTVEVVIRGRVELAPADCYPDGMSLIDCVRLDFEGNPPAFLLDQMQDLRIEEAPCTTTN